MQGVIIRGIKNAFRNSMRTVSIILILAISISLSLIMLLSYNAVQGKIQTVKGSIGNTMTLTPAGINGFEGGGQPLTNEQVDSIQQLAHIVSVTSSIDDRLAPGTDTSLQSAINPGSFGNRIRMFNRGGGSQTNFQIPIMVTGISNTSIFSGTTKLINGKTFDASGNSNEAVVGKDLAAKNNLTVGSTFSAYNTTIKVDGIFDAGSTFANANFYMPLKPLQTLSGQPDAVTQVIVQVDSIANMDTVASAIKAKLGANNVDITTTQDQANQAIAPLQNIATIALYSLIGSLVAGAMIILFTMVMVVRERKREIGVLKAIGASNIAIMLQFVSESLVLTLISAVVGIGLGMLLSEPVLNALVANAQQSQVNTLSGAGGRFQGGFRTAFVVGKNLGGGIGRSLTTLHTTIGWNVLVFALIAILCIAIIGSAFPAWLIAKVKPAEVMRSE